MQTENLEYWFIFQNNQAVLFKRDGTLSLPTSSAISKLKNHFIRQHKLGLFNHVTCYCAEVADETPLPEDLVIIPLRRAFDHLGPDWYVGSARAISIISWDKNHQFCGRCGQATIHKPGSFERTCVNCKLSVFPRISPTIIVLIRKGSQVLMCRSPHFPPGAFGLIAGFVEAGESIEDAVHREVKEEVDIKIKNLQYFGSQFWPFPDSLMLGFTADYESGELTIDTREIETAGWYNYDNLPGRPSSSLSIAHSLLESFINEQRR